ncbi:hypothetical protein BDV98DRAFT_566970 [Pterulicium gracile]|uniref:FAD/NAD(P)-binding domain-containing protein n=1 Tax=Pterulicium gracile TaxID=1884261 RepID=A0A5C3QJR0_9AGAR|nr:hypothetical protein BDV98DRAFT_566970 [Pterula gracilis]
MHSTTTACNAFAPSHTVPGVLCHALFRLQDAPVALAVVLLSTILLYAYLHSKPSHVQRELAVLGTPRSGPLLGTVVICGGGVGGVLAAKACSDHFERVILVEPEFSKTLSGKPKTRVMQYNSAHAFLVIFAEGLRRLWPSFEQRAKDAGALFLSGDYFFHFNGVYTAVPNQGYPDTLTIRRKTLEPLLHRLLVDDSPQCKDRLQVVEGMVRGIEGNADKTGVRGVYGKTNEGEEFRFDDVDLVIDCAGATQNGLKWLEGAGFPVPERVAHNPNLRYMTVTFTVSEELGALLPVPGGYEAATWLYTFLADKQFGNTGFLLGKMDGRTLQLCTTSWGPCDLPKQAEDLELFLRTLHSPEPIPEWLFETVRLLAEGGSPHFSPAKIPGCSHVHYHEAKGLPNNYVALGDATMQLNPIFGQGCSKAMVGVMILDSLLRDCTSGVISPSFSREFFKGYAARMHGTWSSAKAMDYSYPTTQPAPGESLGKGDFMLKAVNFIRVAGRVDGQIALKLWQTRQLLAPGSSILAPGFLLRVGWAHVRRAVGMVKDQPLTVQVCHKE